MRCERCDLPLLLRNHIIVGLMEAALRIVVVGLTLEGKLWVRMKSFAMQNSAFDVTSFTRRFGKISIIIR
jgi:hypothetical protein